MPDDLLFRWILTIEILLLFPIMAVYRVRSQRTGERLDRRQEGIFILVSLRLAGFLCFAGFLAWLINPNLLDSFSAAIPTWLRFVGVGLLAVSGMLNVWTFHNLGKNLTDTVVTRRDHSLVFSGPYRWIRHPFYDGIALFICAIWLATANWYFLATGFGVLALLFIRTPKEEANLVERFGDEYRRYMDSTPRFFPRFSRT